MRAIAKEAPTTSRWLSLLMLLACGSILYLCAMASAVAGPVDKAVPTELKPVTPVSVKAPPPVKTVVVPEPVKAPKQQKCVTVEESSMTYSPGYVISVPGMLVATCGCCGASQVWLNGTFAEVPGQTIGRTSFKEVCQ